MLIKRISSSILQNYQKSSTRNVHAVKSLAFSQFIKDSSEGEIIGNNLIVLHGLFGSKSNWTSLSKAFAKNSNPPRNIFAIDSRNHGDSPHTSDHSYMLMAEDMKKFIEDMNLEKSAVLGHSMGGRAVMLFALHYPHLVEKLVVVDISPLGKIGTTQSNIPLFIHAMRSTTIPSDYTIHQGRKVADDKLKEIIAEKSLRDFLITNLIKTDEGSFKWRINLETLEKCFQEGIAKFPNVENMKFEGETLFIGGTKSDYLRKTDIPAIKKIFPNSSFEFLEAGHWVHAEKSEEFSKLVVKFLNS